MPPADLNIPSVYGLLLAIGILGGLGDAWTYHWARSHRDVWIAAACLVHLASVVLFGLLLRWDRGAFSSAFMLSSVVHVVVVLAADVVVFGGRPTRVEWAGLVLAAVAMLLLEVGREERDRPPGAVALVERADANTNPVKERP